MEFVQLVNRSKSPLSVTYDGRRYVLAPGTNTVPSFLVGPAKRQNRVMGTEDPLNPLDFQSLVGCPEQEDDCSPKEQSKKVEALDRKMIPDLKRRAAKVVSTGRGVSRALISGSDLPEDAGFAAERS